MSGVWIMKRSKMVEVIWNLKINSQMSVVNLVATASARSKPCFCLVCSRFGCDLSIFVYHLCNVTVKVFKFKVDVFPPKIMPHLIHLCFGAGCEFRLLVHQRSKQAWYSSGALSIVIGIDCLVAWLLLKKQTNWKPVNVDLKVRNLQASIDYRLLWVIIFLGGIPLRKISSHAKTQNSHGRSPWNINKNLYWVEMTSTVSFEPTNFPLFDIFWSFGLRVFFGHESIT